MKKLPTDFISSLFSPEQAFSFLSRYQYYQPGTLRLESFEDEFSPLPDVKPSTIILAAMDRAMEAESPSFKLVKTMCYFLTEFNKKEKEIVFNHLLKLKKQNYLVFSKKLLVFFISLEAAAPGLPKSYFEDSTLNVFLRLIDVNPSRLDQLINSIKKQKRYIYLIKYLVNNLDLGGNW